METKKIRKIENTQSAAAAPPRNKIEKISNGRFMVASAAAGDSGDAAVACGLPDGSLAFILSDGMGKGMKAAAESRTVISGLRKLLREGEPPAKAIKIINRRLIAQNGEEENFATVDLTIIDKITGRAKFYKMGAATSFVVCAHGVRRIQMSALPLGMIPKLRLGHVFVKLHPGDIVVMASDGITEADRQDLSAEWMEDYLAAVYENRLKGPKTMASEIVAIAQAKYDGREIDDMTVVVAFIE